LVTGIFERIVGHIYFNKYLFAMPIPLMIVPTIPTNP
jgi:hypothetical protein